MRLSTLSALFLAVSTAFAAPLDSFERRQEAAIRRLALRNDVAYTGGALGIIARSDLENYLLEVRSAAKKQANKAARKERKTAAKAEVHKAGQKAILETNRSVGKKTAKTPEGKKAAAAAGHTAATNKKAELKAAAQAKHDQLKAAGAEHRKATNLPHRTDTFHVAAGGGKPARTYTGKDVRKANFASHIKNSNGDRFGKPFNNNEHAVPGADGSARPVPHMTGVGHEHPLSPSTSHTQMKKDHKAEPARVISQSAGVNHQHQAVIAHDQSRTAGHPGENDHFMVNPAHATRPAPLEGLHGTFMHTRRSELLEAFEH